ncbi:LPS export ABC transporter permease LptF [Palleronia sp. LCG004]|uniref:LPS export ABC transporter permease LptF n=1 Tax=Palleronia sp. LCG004 TaxID=3079304 RepID=UPI002941FB4E|nr:LPS export ABC transporter permease LptF [Palleronia sp. LCG004]WOI55203.1 LPS export ABC transporter permease LptF [Palleronia sp. LCG004]
MARLGRLDRYLLSQLLMLFGFFSLVLVLVYWINRAVTLFDQLISNGQTAIVFLEFTALSLPNVIRVVLPVSAFAASVYVANRLRGESELVIMQSSGFSPARLARPVAIFGMFCALVTLVLTHLLVPLSSGRLDQRAAEIAQDVTAGLLTDGEFLHPTDDVTIFIREITPETELLGLFLSDARDPRKRLTYTARRGLLVRTDDGPRLVMYSGLVQDLDLRTERLATTRFESLSFDISDLVEMTDDMRRDASEVPTWELLTAGPALSDETGDSVTELVYEAHERFTQGLSALVTPLVGFAAMMLGGFSRFGAWRQITGAICGLIAVELVDNIAGAQVLAGAPWPVAYASIALGLILTAILLLLASRPARRARGAAAA